MADCKLQRYVPEKELPDEIKALPKDETVCTFCGVSYLIHHEIKSLEARIKELESFEQKLADSLKAQEQLSQLLEESNRSRELQRLELQQYKEWLASRDAQVVQMKGTVDRLEADLLQRERSLQSLREECEAVAGRGEHVTSRLLSLSSSVQSINHVFSQTKLRDWISETKSQLQVLHNFVPSFAEKLLAEVQSWKERSSRERELLLKELSDERKRYDSLAQQHERMQQDSSSKASKLDVARRDFDSWKVEREREKNSLLSKLSEGSAKWGELAECLETVKAKCKYLSDEVDRMTMDSKAERDLAALKVEELKKKNMTLEKQLREALSELSAEKNHHRQTTDLHCAEQKRLEDALQRSKEEARCTEDRLFALEKDHGRDRGHLLAERDALASKLKDSEIQLKVSSGDLQSALAARKRFEKDTLEQVSQLKRALIDQESRWKSEVESAQNIHNTSTGELEHMMAAKHAQEVSEMKDRFQEMFREHQNSHSQSLQEMKEQYKADIAKLKLKLESCSGGSDGNSEECLALRQALRKEKMSGEAEMMSHIRQVRDLELRLKDFEEQRRKMLTELSALEEEKGREVEAWRERVEGLRREVEKKEAQTRAVDRELQEARDEVTHLESTVHRECEERMELMETLQEAREQLVVARRPPQPPQSRPQSRPSSHGTKQSSPSSQGLHSRSGTPRGSIEESRQRIADMTGRNSRLQSTASSRGRL